MPQIKAIKSALVETWAAMKGTHHIVAELPPIAGRAALESAIHGWVARIDRFYLGRHWAAPRCRHLRMKGIVVFEDRGGYFHAHLVVRPPAKASPFHFYMHAPLWFASHPSNLMRHLYPRPVAVLAKMHVRRIEPTEADLKRVLNYVSKDLIDNGDWKFIEELTPRQILNTV
jgi:hypothetical protein